MDKLSDLSRMIIWLLAGLMFYTLAYAIGMAHPIPQTICQKLGNVTTFAWIGYWVSRMALGRITDTSHPGELQARAIIVAGAVLAGALGL